MTTAARYESQHHNALVEQRPVLEHRATLQAQTATS